MIYAASKILDLTYRNIAKPIAFRFSADSVHESMIATGSFLQQSSFVMELTRWLLRYEDPILQQELFGLSFSSPFGLSAGLDKDAKIAKLIAAVGFGFTEVGSITLEPYGGNTQPWYTRLPKTGSIVVNSGLRSEGVHAVIARMKAQHSKSFRSAFPINASVARTNRLESSSVTNGVADYCATFAALEAAGTADMYTINISCPNTYGGEPFSDPERLSQLLNGLAKIHTTRPVFIKLPIDKTWEQTRDLLEVCAKHEFVRGITIGNLQKNRSRAKLLDPLPDTVKGNLSGVPCREDSNALLAAAYREYAQRFIFSGVGGIFSAEDAYTKIKLGASLVQGVTGLIFGGPAFPGQLNRDLATLLRADGYSTISEAVGADNK